MFDQVIGGVRCIILNTGWGLAEAAANYYSDVLQEAKVAAFFQALNPNVFFLGPNRFKD